jgi:hypothetical protein
MAPAAPPDETTTWSGGCEWVADCIPEKDLPVRLPEATSH